MRGKMRALPSLMHFRDQTGARSRAAAGSSVYFDPEIKRCFVGLMFFFFTLQLILFISLGASFFFDDFIH